MRLVEFLSPDQIVPAVRAARKEDVINELAGYLARQLPEADPKVIARSLMEREKLGTTAIGEGIAIPHAKLAPLDRIVACLGRSRRGADFGSADGAPVHFFFVLLAPPESAGAHLKLLARFSYLFRDIDFRKKLRAAGSADEMYQIIAERETG